MHRFATSILQSARRFPRSLAAASAGATLFGAATLMQAPVDAHDNTADLLSSIDQRLQRIEGKLFPDPYPHANFPTDKSVHPNYPKLQYTKTCMARSLTPELYAKLVDKVSKSGYTFDQALQCGVDSASQTGIAVPDVESYILWKEIIDPILEKRHRKPDGTGFKVGVDKHYTDLDYTKIKPRLDAATLAKYVRSTRIRCARNLEAFPNPVALNRAERREVSGLAQMATETLTGDLAGKFYDLANLTEAETTRLRKDRMLFQRPGLTEMIAPAGGIRDWPDGRGVYHSEDKKFIVWVNEEDQMRLISMQLGGDIIEIFERFVRGVNAMGAFFEGEGHTYKFHPDVGFIGSCPSNWGTGLRSSMMIRIPHLVDKYGEDTLREFANKRGMGLRGANGEHSEIIGGLCELSNFAKIGLSEVELIQIMVDGVADIIELEQTLETGQDVSL